MDIITWLNANRGPLAVRFSTGRDAIRLYATSGEKITAAGIDETAAVFTAAAVAGRRIYSEDAPELEKVHRRFFDAVGAPSIRDARAMDQALRPERFKPAPQAGTSLAQSVASFNSEPAVARQHALQIESEGRMWRAAARRGYRVDAFALADARQMRSAALNEFRRDFGLDVRRPDAFRAAWAEKLGAKVTPTDDYGWSAHSALDLSAVSEAKRPIFDGYKAACSTLKRLQILNGIHRRTDEDGRVHPIVRVNSASTGRMSMLDPGMQSLMTELRPIFLAEPGHDIVSVDHSSAELLALARLVGSPSFTARVTGSDPYQQLADASGCIERKTAKWVLLAWCYGQSIRSLGKKIGTAEAKAVHEAIAALFPEVVEWRAEQTAKAVAQEPLFSLWGRPLPQLLGRRAGQLGLAANLRVQSTARDAYGAGVRAAAESLGEAAMWFPLHDELFVLSPTGRSTATAAALLTAMTIDLGEGVTMTGKSKVTFGRWG